MTLPDQPFASANDDLLRGLGDAFEPVEDIAGSGFEQSQHFTDIEPIANGDVAVVVWTYRCRHVGWFGTVPPTGNVLTIRGTTIVDGRGDETLYHRYIDWLGVYSDLGYTLYQRQMVDDVDRIALNFGPAGPPKGG